uniref:Uncharacterized protein n=1 Tax=Anguilla anguilla TaxID=7936 RepID=A0A0E9WWF2_ANGAN
MTVQPCNCPVHPMHAEYPLTDQLSFSSTHTHTKTPLTSMFENIHIQNRLTDHGGLPRGSLHSACVLRPDRRTDRQMRCFF